MWQSIKDLMVSNKFKVTVFGILALVFTALSGTITWAEVIDKSWPLVVAFIGAQGLADFGKNKVIAEQREITKRQRELGGDCCKKA